MIIRRYGDIPTTYAPDIGEIVEARRGRTDLFAKAVILAVTRMRGGRLKFKVQWLDGDTIAWIETVPGGRPEMIRQIPKDPPPAS